MRCFWGSGQPGRIFTTHSRSIGLVVDPSQNGSSMRRLLITSMSVFVLAVVGVACSSGSDHGSMSGSSTSKPASNGAFNSADVQFARGMIPHHAQAVEMADLATSRGASPAVLELASRIRNAQQPEIDQMSAWLRAWKQDVPSTTGMDMGAHSSMGMMSESEMSGLEAASGAEFDTMFLKMMTAHHEGAVTMARAELKNGKYSQAKALAQAIIQAQEAEITEMQQILAGE